MSTLHVSWLQKVRECVLRYRCVSLSGRNLNCIQFYLASALIHWRRVSIATIMIDVETQGTQRQNGKRTEDGHLLDEPSQSHLERAATVPWLLPTTQFQDGGGKSACNVHKLAKQRF